MKLLKLVQDLKKSNVKKLVDARIKQFKAVHKSDVFNELCFCILTANFNAERSMTIQKKIGNGFLTLSISSLTRKLKQLGHRFPNTRARYIVEARKFKNSLQFSREWLVKNIKGIGMKEASHFLRNIGFEDFAIIDFHIINILTKYKLIKRPKTLTKSNYLEIESILRKLTKKLNLSLGELDLYLWFIETGKVLK